MYSMTDFDRLTETSGQPMNLLFTIQDSELEVSNMNIKDLTLKRDRLLFCGKVLQRFIAFLSLDFVGNQVLYNE